MASLHKRSESGYWYIHFKDHRGKPAKVSTGEKLRSKADQVFDEWKKGRSKTASGNVFLSEMIPIVLKYVKQNLPRSYNIYEEILNQFMDLIGDKQVKLISVVDIEEYKELRGKMRSQKYKNKLISPITINKEVRTIKAAFNKAFLKCKVIPSFNLAEAEQIKVPKKRDIRIFDESTLDLISGNIKTESTLKAFIISRYTGMRLNEIINLQVMDLQDGFIHVRNKPDIGFYIKNDEERKIPIADKLQIYLDEWLGQLTAPERFLICKEDGTRFTKGYISRNFTKWISQLDIDGHFHILRHTWITELGRKGVDSETIRSLAGHSSIKTTNLYMHSDNEIKRKAVNKI